MNTTPATPRHGAEDSLLGRPVAYQDHYAPELLFPIERQLKRDELGIRPEALPFVGEDLWNAYEVSWLNPRGKPVVAIGTLKVPASSPRLIESKSLKLYFNSFNQQVFADLATVEATVARDLSAAAGAPVAVALHSLNDAPERHFAQPEGVLLDDLDIAVDRYQPNPETLSASGAEVEETLYSHLLKSNCLVTGQPDWGTLFVRYQGPAIDREGLLRYLISFRQHNEFHEQCVERVFTDVLARCRPSKLAVWARYTRRGGLDINPFRSTGHYPAPDNGMDVRQ